MHTTRTRLGTGAAVLVATIAGLVGLAYAHPATTVDFDGIDPLAGQAAEDAANAAMAGTGASLEAGVVTTGAPITDGDTFVTLTSPNVDDLRINFDVNVDAVSVRIGTPPASSLAAAYDAAGNLVDLDTIAGSATLDVAAPCIRSVLIENSSSAFLIDDLVFHQMDDDSTCDDDLDGVINGDDLCDGTVMGANDAGPEEKHNRVHVDATGQFISGAGDAVGVTITDTAGCSATQIIEAAGLGKGHRRFGLSRGALLDWVEGV